MYIYFMEYITMINTSRLRRIVGWLAVSLPWIVGLLTLIFQSGVIWPESISATYFYASCITPFMIILGSASILLMCYSGYDKTDDVLNTIASIFGLGICLFPTWGPSEFIGTFQLPVALSSTFHNICAIAFFALLAYISIFQFTKSSGEMTKNKRIRNVIYVVCGFGMLLSFGLMLLPYFAIQIWLVEMIALTFFGLSWLTKADCYKWLFAD